MSKELTVKESNYVVANGIGTDFSEETDGLTPTFDRIKIRSIVVRLAVF
jgi:hypothetical protein